MNLRTRLLIVALLALTVFVAAFYVLTGVTIDRTYARVDNESAQRQVLRAHSYMDYVLGALGSTCSDWAYWDDTYEFVLDHNAAYVDSNLSPTSLATIDVDVMVFLDTSGKVVSAKFQTLANQTLDDTVADLVKQLRPGTTLWTQAMVDPGLPGYLQVGKRDVMVAARPILTSASTGPARGVLVFVGYLDDAFFAGMAETVGGPVTFQPVSQVQPDTVESRALALLTQGQSTVGLPTGTDEVRGFEQHTDLAGNPAFLLATTAKRTQSTEITQLKRIVVLATSMIGAILAAIAIVMMNHFVLQRITSLGRQVTEVGHTSNLALRVRLSGSDELAQLATDINATLESLQHTQQDKNRMAEELEQDRKRLHDYFDHAHDLIFALDTSGKVTLVNQSACSVLGYEEKDLLGRSMLDIVGPDSREVMLRANDEVGSGDIVARSVDVLTRDGNRRTLDVSGQRLWDNEQLTVTFYIARDITERLRMEHELLRNQSLESLGMLAAGIAHDFNNVLTVVKGNISLADSSLEEPTESQHYLEVARIAADRAQALAGQLLTFSRGGAPVKENIDVESIIQEVARFTLIGSNVALQVSVDGVLAAVEGDRNQLFQMLQNIILNARDAMPSGGALNIALRSQTVSEEHPIGFAAPGDCVVIQITDTGPGIAPEDMKHLFDPFFTTKPSGHGVGLATARSIARRHGGDLLIESAAGKGTTVQLCMPVARGPVTQPKAAKPEREHGSATTGRLLVMDDEQTVADVTCAMAQRLGYETTAVPDGAAALTAYAQAVTEQHPFDLVIMDLTVPGGMGGREAVQKLHELYPDARVIV